MKNKKTSTFIYRGLGFPIKLIKAPMKKIFDDWFIDINMNKLQAFALRALAHKSAALTGAELCFIRKYLQMTISQFSKFLGIHNAAVLEWEKTRGKIAPPPRSIYSFAYSKSCERDRQRISRPL